MEYNNALVNWCKIHCSLQRLILVRIVSIWWSCWVSCVVIVRGWPRQTRMKSLRVRSELTSGLKSDTFRFVCSLRLPTRFRHLSKTKLKCPGHKFRRCARPKRVKVLVDAAAGLSLQHNDFRHPTISARLAQLGACRKDSFWGHCVESWPAHKFHHWQAF